MPWLTSTERDVVVVGAGIVEQRFPKRNWAGGYQRIYGSVSSGTALRRPCPRRGATRSGLHRVALDHAHALRLREAALVPVPDAVGNLARPRVERVVALHPSVPEAGSLAEQCTTQRRWGLRFRCPMRDPRWDRRGTAGARSAPPELLQRTTAAAANVVTVCDWASRLSVMRDRPTAASSSTMMRRRSPAPIKPLTPCCGGAKSSVRAGERGPPWTRRSVWKDRRRCRRNCPAPVPP